MTRAIGPDDKIPCPTVECLVQELETLEHALEGQEREDTWERFERGILRFAAVTRGGAHKFVAVYVEGIGVKGLGPKVVECMLSDRGRLSGVATDFLTSMAPRLSNHFHPLTPLYIPPLIRLLARPNKVYLRRAEKCVMTILTHCPAPGLIGSIKVGIEDKNEACRRSCGAALEKMMREWSRELIGAKGVVELESAMRRMATEKDAEVRKIGKRMWAVYEAKWPERIQGFTAPLTPTIKKYLDISQTKSSTARTLFPPAPPPPRARHPLAQTTSAPAPAAEAHRPAVSRSATTTTTTTTTRDRNMQAIRGLGRAGSTENAGIRPFLLRSASAVVPVASSSRAVVNRSVSVANVFANEHVEEEGPVGTEQHGGEGEDRSSTEGATSGVFATRPRVITHASAPTDLASSAQRTQQAQRAAAGTGAVRRVRVVSGLTHVAEAAAAGRAMAPGVGLGRPQGAVRPTAAASASASAGAAGRVVSSSATIGVGARSGTAPVKPPRMVGPASASASVEHKTVVGSRAPGDSAAEGQVDGRVRPVNGDGPTRTGGGVKMITTNPGGTTKTRQFFRPTSTASSSSASSSAATSRPTATEPRRVVGRTAVTGARSAGLTAPTASSAAKMHRVPADALGPIVSPRRPRPKLKPPIPVFMPTSKTRAQQHQQQHAPTAGTRPRVKTSAAAVVVEPASVPLPESPAPRRVMGPMSGEAQGDDPFAAAMEMEIGAGSSVPEESKESAIQSEAKHDEIDDSNEERDLHDDAIEPVPISSDSGAVAAAAIDDSAPASTETAAESSTTQLATEEDSTRNEAEAPRESVSCEQPDTLNLQKPESQPLNPPTVESVYPAATLEVNLIDLDGPELSVTEPVHPAPLAAKRTPLGPAASPNQMTVPRKMTTPETKSPKVQQLSDFFESKAFSPSPSPERAVQLAVSGRRSSTTPLSTPPRPRVLN